MMFWRVSLHLESICLCLAVNRYLAKIVLSKLAVYQRGLVIGLDFDEEYKRENSVIWETNKNLVITSAPYHT